MPLNELQNKIDDLYVQLNKIRKKYDGDKSLAAKSDPRYKPLVDEIVVLQRLHKQRKAADKIPAKPAVKAIDDAPAKSAVKAADDTPPDLDTIKKTRNKLYAPQRRLKQKHGNDPAKFKADPEYQKVTVEINALNRQIRKLEKEQAAKPAVKSLTMHLPNRHRSKIN